MRKSGSHSSLAKVAVAWAAACWMLLQSTSSLGVASQADNQAKPVPKTFETAELNAFLAKVASAEAIGDPLRRCLAYPDPPGSHWPPDTIAAYCRYHNLPVVGLAEARSLIESGHADKLDRRLREALRLQRGDPDLRGLLDETYQLDFGSPMGDARKTLDSWKAQSPRSAFAYAASGYAYVNAAQAARGGKWIGLTSAAQLAAMRDLLALARKDLDRAVELDPHVTPIYKAMLMTAKLEGDDSYAEAAIRHGLEVDPANFSIYVHMMAMAEPKWGGSVSQMRQIADAASQYAHKNPLMRLLQPEPELQAARVCNCADRNADPSAFRTILDRPVRATSLIDAANVAAHAKMTPLALVYKAEALRFAPESGTVRRDLIALLSDAYLVNDLQDRIDPVARMLADREVRSEPSKSRSYLLRGEVYEMAGEFARAEPDLSRAVALAPDDIPELTQLATHYTIIKQWEKAWNVSSHLIQVHPESLNGWLLREHIQRWQPRAGMRDTARYIVEHFRDDKSVREYVEEAQYDLTHDPPPQQSHAPASAPSLPASKSPQPDGDE
jgi:tetratricopeptide (TPR) repeat protein